MMTDLVDDSLGAKVSEDSVQLIKFHGSYMQDDRERRTRQGKYYQFMLRTRQPAGVVTNHLYLTMDALADQYGNGSLRLTTRQAYQLHGVLKKDLKTVFSTITKNMGSTLGACGDVNRNITAPPAPFTNHPGYKYCVEYSNMIADLLAPQSGAYYDVWLDGEKFYTKEMEDPKVTRDRAFNGFGTNFDGCPEPIYGPQFLPRKFKIGITVPGDNHIDLFTNDLGLVVMCDEATGELEGFNVVVGGGMGRSHRNEATFAMMAEPIGYVPKDDIFHAVKAIVATQRDYGRRDDRKQARLKYLLHEWGMDKFRRVTEQYYGKQFEAFKPLPPWEHVNYLGWGEQGDGKLYCGVYVQNGRVKGVAKKAFREVVEKYGLNAIITAEQDLVLTGIDPADRAAVQATLEAAGLDTEAGAGANPTNRLDASAIACPALPLCGLAMSEAERGLPDINARLVALLDRMGLGDESFVVRMTGCPNGCARPYMAEVGFVGDGPRSYQIWLGGSPGHTRLAEPFMDKMKVDKLEETFEPLFSFFKARRQEGESFGDFCARVGFDVLRAYLQAYVPPKEAVLLPRVGIEPDAFEALKLAAEAQNMTLSQFASEAIAAHAAQVPGLELPAPAANGKASKNGASKKASAKKVPIKAKKGIPTKAR